MTATHPIFAEVEALLDDAAEAPLAELEHTLTAGYAAALALEAERMRTERKIAYAAAQLGDGEGHGKAEEIARLARRLNSADKDLARLRTLLEALRGRASAARAA
jgi:hypothetical protein